MPPTNKKELLKQFEEKFPMISILPPYTVGGSTTTTIVDPENDSQEIKDFITTSLDSLLSTLEAEIERISFISDDLAGDKAISVCEHCHYSFCHPTESKVPLKIVFEEKNYTHLIDNNIQFIFRKINEILSYLTAQEEKGVVEKPEQFSYQSEQITPTPEAWEKWYIC